MIICHFKKSQKQHIERINHPVDSCMFPSNNNMGPYQRTPQGELLELSDTVGFKGPFSGFRVLCTVILRCTNVFVLLQ